MHASELPLGVPRACYTILCAPTISRPANTHTSIPARESLEDFEKRFVLSTSRLRRYLCALAMWSYKAWQQKKKMLNAAVTRTQLYIQYDYYNLFYIVQVFLTYN